MKSVSAVSCSSCSYCDAVGLGGIRYLVPRLGTRGLVLGTAADARCDVVAASAVLLGAVSSARAADQWFVMGQRTLNATDPSAEIKTEGARFKKDVKQVRLAVEGADVQMIKVVLGCSLTLCSFQLHGFVAFR